MNVDISSLYSPRMLVFLETDPQTNEYHQVLLTKQQYKKVSQHICELITPADVDGIEEVELNTSEETYFLPDIKDVID